MANYTRPGSIRFFLRGMSLKPQDALEPDEVGYIRNMRSYQRGTIEPRYGLTKISTGSLSGPVHSLYRLNDPDGFGGEPTQQRYAGATTKLFRGSVGAPVAYSQVYDGFSGDPLSFVTAAPVRSPKPWAYVGDRLLNRKVDTAGNTAPLGCRQPHSPSDEPSATVDVLQFLVLDGGAALTDWAAVGTAGGAITQVSRCNTIASAILYDSGTTGNCSIVPADFTNIIQGAILSLNLSPGPGDEEVIVASVQPAVGSTTIAAVIFDAGATGLCTIQPTTSLATGQLESASFTEAQDRFSPGAVPPAGAPSVVRTVDFAVNSLVSLNGGPPVRVLSVAQGTDGVISFRCNSPAALAAGQTIAGVAAFRTTTAVNHPNGVALFATVNAQVLTAANATDPFVGGLQVGTPIVVDASQITGANIPRATQPDDDIVLAFRADLLAYVNEVRFFLNVDPDASTPAIFLKNYYQFAWRANDLIAAIQSSNAAVTDTMQQARQNSVLQTIADQNPIPPPVDPELDTGSPQYAITGPAASTSSNAIGITAQSNQLALGNNQWILLRCKVGDLQRIGMDSTLTLANINAIQILVQIQGTTSPVTVEYADFYLSGGFGPDVRDTLPPYLFCYRHRSSSTGAIGNPSPPTRGGVFPRRQRVILQGTASTENTVDLDDWFVRGGSLATWSYAGSVPTGTIFNFDAADSAVDGGETVTYDHYQPWPISDLPRSGTCNVAGTAIQWVSGDTFNVDWAPGSAVLVNGLAATIYAVASSTLLFVNENVGSGTAVSFAVIEPLILAQPLPVFWPVSIGGAIFTFAAGDSTDPTALHWTNGNDPDATSDKNWLFIANEQVQNGGTYNAQPFVFTTDNLYRITPTFGQVSDFRVDLTPCGYGLWAKWAFCLTPEGIVFLAKDGIRLTANGAPAISLSDPDLRPIFPNEGATGETTRGIVPPDMTQTTRLRLAYVDGKVFFDYVGIDGADYTLIYDIEAKGWLFDRYDESGIRTRYWEIGSASNTEILGAESGFLYEYDSTVLLDGAAPIDWEVWTAHTDGGDARAVKQFGDVMLDCQPGATLNGFTITPVADNGLDVLSSTVGAAAATRTQYVIDINTGQGVLSRNLGLRIAGQSNLCDLHRPLFYLWEPSFLDKTAQIQERATDWDDLGYAGAKFVQGIVIRANTYGVNKTVNIEADGGAVQQTLTINHNGEQEIAYPLSASGWTPFLSQLVRLRSADTVPWLLLNARWVAEPAPELASQWSTQDTTFDQDGFLSMRDGVIAYLSTAPIALTVYHDQVGLTYTLPSSSGVYIRSYFPFQAAKGKSVRFTATSDQPFRIFKRDCTFRALSWAKGYMAVQPFGGPSRTDGAAI